MKKQVLIADADKNFRNELEAALKSNDEFEVVGVAADGEQALHVLQTKQADVLVMDLLLPRVDGLTILAHMRSMHNPPKVLITTAFISKYVANSAAHLGVQQLLCKPCSVDTIIKNLRRMENGGKRIPMTFFGNGDKNIGSLVTNVLHEIGVPANIKGHRYLREAIVIAVGDMGALNAVTRDLYEQVAKTYQTTSKCVERAIRTAIETAWDRGDLDTLQRYFGYTVSNTKGKPTNSEFIAIVADRIQLWMNGNAVE